MNADDRVKRPDETDGEYLDRIGLSVNLSDLTVSLSSDKPGITTAIDSPNDTAEADKVSDEVSE